MVGFPRGASDVFDPDESDEQAEIVLKAYAKEGKIGSLSASELARYLAALIQGNCVAEEEHLIIKILDGLSIGHLEGVVSALGNGSLEDGVDELDSGIDGDEWVKMKTVLAKSEKIKVFIKFGSSDTDELAQLGLKPHFDKKGKAKSSLHSLSTGQIAQYIVDLVEGNCGDEEEQLINDVLEATANHSVARMEQIVSILGGGPYEEGVEKLDSGIDGAEWTKCKEILGRSAKIKPHL